MTWVEVRMVPYGSPRMVAISWVVTLSVNVVVFANRNFPSFAEYVRVMAAGILPVFVISVVNVDEVKKLGARLTFDVPLIFKILEPKVKLYIVFGTLALTRSTLLIFLIGFARYTEYVFPFGNRLESLVLEST